MINVVDHALTVSNSDQSAHYVDDVFFIQGRRAQFVLSTQTSVELHTPYCRQVVTLRGKEQIVEEILSRFFGRRLSRTHHSIYFDKRLEHTACGVHRQRIGDERTAVIFIGVEGFDRIDPFLSKLGKQCGSDLGVALC